MCVCVCVCACVCVCEQCVRVSSVVCDLHCVVVEAVYVCVCVCMCVCVWLGASAFTIA